MEGYNISLAKMCEVIGDDSGSDAVQENAGERRQMHIESFAAHLCSLHDKASFLAPETVSFFRIPSPCGIDQTKGFGTELAECR